MRKAQRMFKCKRVTFFSLVTCSLTVIMTTLIALLTVIIQYASCSQCENENIGQPPVGIQLFDHTFDIKGNIELQELRKEVIKNKCNFGSSHLSSSIFSFAEGYINLHCGAFGAQPKYVIKYQDQIRNVLYSRPHLWDDVYSQIIMNLLRQEMANYLGITNLNDLVFTINTSHGINAIIRSIMDHFLASVQNQTSDDIAQYSIIYFNTAHPAFISPLKYYQKLWNINLIEIKFDENIVKEYDHIIETINDTLISMDDTERERIIFAVFSHISSLPSLILPLKEIVSLFNEYNIMSVVDGAHSMGQIYDLNINDINPDFYVGNAYKWFYSVWNTAIIYVKQEYQYMITPLAMAYYKNASFQKLFHHPGSVDESPYLSLMGSLEFRYLIGGDENIINYIHKMAIQTQQYLANLWNTTIFISNEDYFSGMVNVELPSIDGVVLNKEKINDIFFMVLEQNDIAIKLFEWNGKFYIRISCQIYTNMQQIQQIGDLILQYLNKMKLQLSAKSNDDNDEIIKKEEL